MMPGQETVDYGEASNEQQYLPLHSQSYSEDAAVEQASTSTLGEMDVEDVYLGQLVDGLLENPTYEWPRWGQVKHHITYALGQMEQWLWQFEDYTSVKIAVHPALDPPDPREPRRPGLLEEVDREAIGEYKHELRVKEFRRQMARVATIRDALEDISARVCPQHHPRIQFTFDSQYSRLERALLFIEEIMKESPLYDELMMDRCYRREAEEKAQLREVEEHLRRNGQPVAPYIEWQTCARCNPYYIPPSATALRVEPPQQQMNWTAYESQPHHFKPIQDFVSPDGSQQSSQDSGIPDSPPPVNVNEEVAMINAACPEEFAMCTDDDSTASLCSTSRESSPLTMDQMLALRTNLKFRDEFKKKLGSIKQKHQKSMVASSSSSSSSSLHLSREDLFFKEKEEETAEEKENRLRQTAYMHCPHQLVLQEKESTLREKDRENFEMRKTINKLEEDQRQAMIRRRHEMLMKLASKERERKAQEDEERRRFEDDQKEMLIQMARHEEQRLSKRLNRVKEEEEKRQAKEAADKLAREMRKEKKEAEKEQKRKKEEERRRRAEEEQKRTEEKARREQEKRQKEEEDRRVAQEAADQARREEEERRNVEERLRDEEREQEALRIAALDREARRAERKRLEDEARARAEEEAAERRRVAEEKRREIERQKAEAAANLEKYEKEQERLETERRKKQREEDAERRAEEQRELQARRAREREEEEARAALSMRERLALEEEEKRRKREELEQAVVATALLTPPCSPQQQQQRQSKSARRRANRIGSRLQSAESVETLNSLESSLDSDEWKEREMEDIEEREEGKRRPDSPKFEVAVSKATQKKKEKPRFRPEAYVEPKPELSEQDRRDLAKRRAFETQQQKEAKRVEQAANNSRETTPSECSEESQPNAQGGLRAFFRGLNREKKKQRSKPWDIFTGIADFRANQQLIEDKFTMAFLSILGCFFIVVAIIAAAGWVYSVTVPIVNARYPAFPQPPVASISKDLPVVCPAKQPVKPTLSDLIGPEVKKKKMEPDQMPLKKLEEKNGKKEKKVDKKVKKGKNKTAKEPSYDYLIPFHDEAQDNGTAPAELTERMHCLLWVFKPGPLGACLCISAPGTVRVSAFPDAAILDLADDVGVPFSRAERAILARALPELRTMTEEARYTVELSVTDRHDNEWRFVVPSAPSFSLLAKLQDKVQEQYALMRKATDLIDLVLNDAEERLLPLLADLDLDCSSFMTA